MVDLQEWKVELNEHYCESGLQAAIQVISGDLMTGARQRALIQGGEVMEHKLNSIVNFQS